MAEADVIKRLDTMISILQLAYTDEIQSARTRIRSDVVNAAVLEAAEADFIGAGKLKTDIARATGQSAKTVQRRIGELVALGALEKEGSGPSVSYKATGLI